MTTAPDPTSDATSDAIGGIEPAVLWDLRATLGEGALWDPVDARVWFLDIKNHRVHRCAADGSERRTWTAPGQVSFIVDAGGGTMVCGVGRALMRFDPRDGSFTTLTEVEPDRPGNRLNDAFVDARGRLWFGTMDDGEKNASGALYRYMDGQVTRMDDGYVVTNGPSVSPDGRTLYHNHTDANRVLAFDLDDAGALSNRRVFAAIEDGGSPDGMAVDAAGCLWVCTFGGHRILRFDPSGRRIGEVRFPVANVTRLAFGGPDLRTVFATTARKGLSEDELAQQPLAGDLFTFRVETPGLAQPPMRLA